MWYSLHALTGAEDSEIVAEITVEADSPFFSGHFPDNPILPGIAQVGLVAELISRVRGERMPVLKLKRIKFKKLIHPGERLLVRIYLAGSEGSYAFRLNSGTQEVCTGTIFFSVTSAPVHAP